VTSDHQWNGLWLVSSWWNFSSSSQASRHTALPGHSCISEPIRRSELCKGAGAMADGTDLIARNVIVIPKMHLNRISRRCQPGPWVRSAHFHQRASWQLGSFVAFQQPTPLRWVRSAHHRRSSFSRLGSFGTSGLAPVTRGFGRTSTTTDCLLSVLHCSTNFAHRNRL
jgi:hypothetical protein